MKHPALLKMLGLFLAVVSLLTAAAGGLGFRGAEKDHRELLRQIDLLETRIEEAEDLLSRMDEMQDENDAAEQIIADRRGTHDSARSAFRTKLGKYTATKAGVVLGRRQLDEAADMLKQSMDLFQIGLSIFLQGEEAFQPVWEAYQSVRGAMDQALAIYGEAASEQPEDGEDEVSFSPEQVLALVAVEHELYGQIEELLEQQQAATPADQRMAAQYLKQAIDGYGELSPLLQDFSLDRLVYEAGKETYDRAAAELEAGGGGDGSDEAARTAADEICRESFGMDFDELGEWLSESEPEPAEGGESAISLSPEMLDQLLEELPGDAELIGTAIGLIEESDRALSEKEAAFRADPHDMSAAELLLAVSKEGLDGSERLFSLVEPTIVQTHAQLQSAHEQLDAAWYSIYTAQEEVKENYRKLDETAAELEDERKELEETSSRLETEYAELAGLQGTVDSYAALHNRFLSLRSTLLDDERVFDAVSADGDLIAGAKTELARRTVESSRELPARRLLCAVMLSAGLCGLVTALGAFETPRIRRLWLPLGAALLFAAAGELISFRLGRGLWYTAVFILLFGVLMLPLTLGKRKEGSV